VELVRGGVFDVPTVSFDLHNVEAEAAEDPTISRHYVGVGELSGGCVGAE
jgi:hypothetical protein